MKKLLLITLCIILAGCTKKQEEVIFDDVPHYSEHFIDESYLFTYVYNADYRRLEAIQQNEITQFVYLNGTTEVSITDKDELAKVQELFQSIKIVDDSYYGESKENALLIACYVKGHDDPIRFAVNGNVLESLDYHHVNMNLSDEVLKLKGDDKEVLPIKNDYYYILKNTCFADLEYQKKQEEEQKWNNVLELAHVIHEEFDDVSELDDQSDLMGGIAFLLLKEQKAYHCFDNEYCTNEVGDQIDFKDKNSFAVPDVYSVLPYGLIEKRGKEIFNQYAIPNVENLIYKDLFYFAYSYPESQLVSFHTPYEAIGFFDYDDLYIKDIEKNGNERVYTVLKYGIHRPFQNENITEVILNEDKQIVEIYEMNDYSELNTQESLKSIFEESEQFAHWEYVLREDENGNVQFVSAKKIKEAVYPASVDKIDSSLGVFVKEDNRLFVNIDSASAKYFNKMYHSIDSSYRVKFNQYEDYLSILIRNDDQTNAYVFNLKNGKTMTSEEVMQQLNIKSEKVKETVSSIYPDAICLEKEDYYIHKNGPDVESEVFISSDGKPAVIVSECESDVVVMEWEEVQ